MADILSYTNTKAIRNQRLIPLLESRLTEAVTNVYGDGYTAQIYSGGQPAKGRRTGSVRHNHGRAADVYIVDPNGKRVTGDGLAPLGQYWAAKKYGGVGLEMNGGGIHLDAWSKPPRGGGMSWNYARQGGRYTPGQKNAIQAGLSGELPELNGRGLGMMALVDRGDQPDAMTAFAPEAPVPTPAARATAAMAAGASPDGTPVMQAGSTASQKPWEVYKARSGSVVAPAFLPGAAVTAQKPWETYRARKSKLAPVAQPGTPPMVMPEVGNQEMGTLTAVEPGILGTVGNKVYDTLNALGLPANRMRQDMRSVDSFVRGVADVPTFGTADEIAAGAGALTGVGGKAGDYDANLAGQRAENDVRMAENPVATIGGQIAGGVALGALTGPLGAGVGYLRRVGQGAALGMTGGGLYGFGSGEGGIENRLTNAAKGAGAGLALGATIPAATGAVSKTYNTVMDATVRPAMNMLRSTTNPSSNALGLTQRALARDSVTPIQAGQRLQDAIDAGDESTMLMDVAGDNTRRLARYAANIPGEGADRLKTAVADRQLAQPERITDAVRKGLDDPERYFSTVDDIIATRQANAKPLYDKAYANPVPYTRKLKDLLGRGKVMRTAVKNARDLAEAEGLPSQQFFAKIADDGSFTVEGVPDARQWDYVKRSLDDIVADNTETLPNGSEKLTNLGRVVSGIKREMLQEIDSHNPDYAAARKAFSSSSESMKAVTQGGKLLDADPELARRTLSAMSEGDKQLARLGISKALVDRVQKGADGLNMVRAIFGSPRKRAVLKEAFPTKEAFEDFKSAMEREATKTRTKNAVGGNSTTAQQITDIADNQVDAGVAGKLLTGDLTGAIGTAVQKMMSRATVVNEATAKEIAETLTTSDPKVATRVIAEMQRRAMKDERLARNLARVMTSLRRGAINFSTQRTTDAIAAP